MTSHHTQCSDLACSIPSLGWLCPMTASHHCSKPQRAPPRHAPLEQCCLLAPSIQSFQIPQPSTHLLHKSNPRHTRPTRLHPIQRTHSPTCTANTRYSPNPTHTPNPTCTQNTTAPPGPVPSSATAAGKAAYAHSNVCFSGKHEHLLPPWGVHATQRLQDTQ